LGDEARCSPGIGFCAKAVLRTGVALLGLRMTATHFGDLGWWPVVLVCCAVVLTILFGVLLSRRLGLGTLFGVLTGGAVAICGVSAAIAIAAVLPRRETADRELIFTVIGVTGLSTLAMIMYPPVAGALGLGPVDAGIFLGGTIHDVAQVVGAGYSISDHTGDIATLVKLLRVAMLVPVVLVLMLFFRRQAAEDGGGHVSFPVFLIGFIVLAAGNSLGMIPERVVEVGNALSQFCLITAIAAVGIRTVLREVVRLGWPPVLLMVAETLFIALFMGLAYGLNGQG
ncbi:MAG: putative sulfate exporter family transporter, partial [Gammaproteobacteria bacterium]|nr:putative sulfate exporter family transporter [Gammaproteobacteria bacterium]